MAGYHLTVCLNPTLQKTFWFPKVELAQVNRVSRQREDASGKGINVTRVLTQLGEQAVHVTQVGGAGADRFLELARDDKLDVRPVRAAIEIRNCYTLLDAGAGTTTELVEAGDQVSSGVEEDVRSAVTKLFGEARSLVISGSKAPGFSSELYPGLVERAQAAGLYVLIDVRGEDLIRSLPYRPDVVKINVSEFSATFLADQIPEERETSELPSELFEKLADLSTSGTSFVLTNGGRPTVVAHNGTTELIDVVPAEPVNAIGCGDAVTAGVVAGWARGMELGEAVRLGHECAAKNVVLEKPGTIE
jgi:1-phosphofructokinase/tagatose 6-phosphate kinase